jgi:pilus assembly protein CpaF
MRSIGRRWKNCPESRALVTGKNLVGGSLNAQELEDFIDEIIDEMTGLGPIEPLLKDPTINDILINGHECVYVERAGMLEPTPVRFKDEQHLLRIVNKIVSAVGRRVDESQPLCDARLLDGSRINIAVRPIAVDGPLVSIRKFSKKPFTASWWTSGDPAADGRAAGGRGGRASPHHLGRHRLKRPCSTHCRPSEKERPLTIEDAELYCSRTSAGWKPAHPLEGGRDQQRELSRTRCASARSHHPRECRGEEAFDMLQR